MSSKERQKEHAKKHYLKNKEKCKDRARKCSDETRRKTRALSLRYRALRGCSKCGYNKCTRALEYHHLGSKDGNVSRMISQGCGVKRIKEEIRKCVVLCANCHRELHDAE